MPPKDKFENGWFLCINQCVLVVYELKWLSSQTYRLGSQSNSVTIPYFSVFSVHFWNFQTNVELSFNFHHRYAGAGWGVLEMSEESYGVPLGVSGGGGKAFFR